MPSAPPRVAQPTEAQFEADNARLLVRRLAFALFVSLSFVAVTGLFGSASQPVSGERIFRNFVLQVGVAAIGLGICRLRPSPRLVEVVAPLLMAHLLARLAVDATLLDSQPE